MWTVSARSELASPAVANKKIPRSIASTSDAG
jgi:hypothetical protein